MSSSLYTQQGVDFDVWFGLGTGSQYVNIYGSSGQDIGQRYYAGSGGPATGWTSQDGQDLCNHFSGYGFGIYRVGGVPWNTYRGGDVVNWWTNWLKTFATKHTACKCMSGIMDDCYYRDVCSDQDGDSIAVFAWSPIESSEVTLNYEVLNRETRKCGNSAHRMYETYVTINSHLKAVVVNRGCGAGDGPCAEYRFTASQWGQGTVQHQGIYGCWNDDNCPEYGTYGESMWKWNRYWTWHP